MTKVDVYSFLSTLSKKIKISESNGFLVDFLNVHANTPFWRIQVVSISRNPLALHYNALEVYPEKEVVGPIKAWPIDQGDFFVEKVLPPKRGSPFKLKLRFY